MLELLELNESDVNHDNALMFLKSTFRCDINVIPCTYRGGLDSILHYLIDMCIVESR